MKGTLLLSAVLLIAVTSFADTSINNFTGYNDQWPGFGGLGGEATFGELFTIPNNATNLSSFSFYMGNPWQGHNDPIITGAYIATWTGTHAGTLLYSSPQITYDNMGDEEITVNPGILNLSIGQQYVMFLSVSQYYGQSDGLAQVSGGGESGYLYGFVDIHSGSDFNSVFTDPWDGPSTPDLAVDLEFNSVPEPASLLLLGSGVLAGVSFLHRKVV